MSVSLPLGISDICTAIKLSREFGLTPSSRSRLEVPPEPRPESATWKFIQRARERRPEGKGE